MSVALNVEGNGRAGTLIPGIQLQPHLMNDAGTALATLAAVANAASLGLALLDGELRYLMINERLAAINGRAAGDHLGHSIHEIVPELAATLMPSIRQVLDPADPAPAVEITVNLVDEKRLPLHWKISLQPLPLLSPAGVPERGVLVVVLFPQEEEQASDHAHVLIADLVERTAELRAANARLELELAERARAETALQQANSLLDGLFRYTPIAMQIYDSNGYSLCMNEANRMLLGLPATSYGVGVYNIFTDPFAVENGSSAAFARARAGEVVAMPEVYIDLDRPSNSWNTGRSAFFCDHLIFPIRDEDGTVTAVVSCVTDVTARKQAEARVEQLNRDLERLVTLRTAQLEEAVVKLEAEVAERRRTEEALRASQALLQGIFDHSPATIVVHDPATDRYLLANHRLAHDLDRPLHTILGKTHEEIWGARATAWHEEDARIIASGEALKFEEEMEGPDGRRQITLVIKFPLYNAQGRIYAIGGIYTDITQLRQAEQERRHIERKLLETQKLESLGLLAGGIAHDFNNILTAILGHTELLIADLPPGSATSASVEMVALGARRAADLTRQMLAYAGKGRFVVGPLQLNDIIREMASLLQISISCCCTLHYDLAEDLPLIEADAAQIQQVVLNLLVNASEAIGEGPGAITLTTGLEQLELADLGALRNGEDLAPGRYVAFTIADTGCGMDAATLSRIFDPFFTTRFTGRGLGLAAVLGIIRSHNGALHVGSSPGHGTTFRIWLPTLDQAESAQIIAERLHLSPPPATLRSRGALLVIDDEPAVRGITQRLLERSGFTVYCSADGPAGLQLLEQGLPNLAGVLIDLTMPGMTGDVVARAVQRACPGLPIVLMSGYATEEVASQYADLRLAGFLQKPFSGALLRETLEHALRRSR